MSNGFDTLRQAELELVRALSENNLDQLTYSPETVVALAKVGDQLNQIERELATNEGLRNAIDAVIRQQAQLETVLQDIDFTAIDRSAIESLATSEFVLESAEAAEDELADEVTVDDGISDEETQEVLKWSGLIAAAAAARESAPRLEEDETTILTFLVFVAILAGLGFTGVGPLVGGGVLSEMTRRTLSAAGFWEDGED